MTVLTGAWSKDQKMSKNSCVLVYVKYYSSSLMVKTQKWATVNPMSCKYFIKITSFSILNKP